MLNSSELHKYRKFKSTRVLPELVGDRLPISGDNETERTELEQSQESLMNSLQTKRVIRTGDLCVGTYDENTKLVVLLKKSGKLYQHMGFTGVGGARMLYPEEAVFLVDAGVLELSLQSDGVLLSFEEALSTILRPNVSWEQYFVYSQLTRAGFIVVRHQEQNINDTQQYRQVQIIPSPCESADTSLCSPPAKQGRFLDTPIETFFSEVNTVDVTNNPSSSTTFPVSEWNFQEINIPDNQGGNLTMIATPNFDCLPVLIEYNEARRFCDSRLLSSNAYSRSSRVSKKDKRGSDKFYRPKYWDFVSAKTWKEYKSKKYDILCSSSSAGASRINSVSALVSRDDDEDVVWEKLQIIKSKADEIKYNLDSALYIEGLTQ